MHKVYCKFVHFWVNFILFLFENMSKYVEWKVRTFELLIDTYVVLDSWAKNKFNDPNFLLKSRPPLHLQQ